MEEKVAIKVRTWIGATGFEQEDLTLLDAWQPEIDADDLGWLEGSIEVECAGTKVIEQGDWDLVYVLWVLIVERLEEFCSTGCLRAQFMDQLIEFRCQTVGEADVEVSCGPTRERVLGRKQAVVDRRAFFRALLDEAVHFFRELHSHTLIDDDELREVRAQITEFESCIGL